MNTPPSGQVLTFAPSDDTYVYSTNANTNYGSATTLQVDNSPVKNILMKFSVSGIAGRTVTSAKLRLYAVDPSPVGGEFRRTIERRLERADGHLGHGAGSRRGDR